MRNFIESFKKGFYAGVGLCAGILTTALVAVPLVGTINSFTSGTAVSSTDMNQNFTTITDTLADIPEWTIDGTDANYTAGNVKTDNRVMVGSLNTADYATGTSDAKIHVYTGDSGTGAWTDADELFVESNGNAGITIGVPAANTGALRFAEGGSPGNTEAGALEFNASNDTLYLRTGGFDRMSINQTNAIFNGNVLMTGTLVQRSAAFMNLRVNCNTSITVTSNTYSCTDVGAKAITGGDSGYAFLYNDGPTREAFCMAISGGWGAPSTYTNTSSTGTGDCYRYNPGTSAWINMGPTCNPRLQSITCGTL